MPKHRLKPTEAELNILNVLWQNGPSTVREVFEILQPGQASGYTTVLKTMQIMFEKGLVKRNDKSKAHIYTAANPQSATQSHLVNDLLVRAFDGSKSQLIMRALDKTTSAEDIAELRNLLDKLEAEQNA